MDRNVWKKIGIEDISGKEPSPAEKLLMYFPVEALALYATLEPAVGTVFNGNVLKVALWSSLAISILFCIFFLRRFWKVARASQLAISAGSLVLYVASLGGPFATTSWYKPGYGLLASILATAFLIFVPTPSKPVVVPAPAGPA
jgi:hypothetical protein